MPLRSLAVVLAMKHADAVCVDALQEESKDTGTVFAEGRVSEADFNILGAQPAEKSPLDVDNL